MEISDAKFAEIRTAAKKAYEAVGAVACPYFNGEAVRFNIEGFKHVLFKSWDTPRSRIEQYTRLRLLPLAAEIIKKSGTLQEYSEKETSLRQQSNGKWTTETKIVRFYAFVAIVKNMRMKVIVRSVPGEWKKFHSVYPAWRTEIGRDGERTRMLYSGNLETD